jgi:hypothetical protein
VAKLAIASGLGPEGRGFKSHQPEYNYVGQFQPKAGWPLARASASGLGPEGRGFKSHIPEYKYYVFRLYS